MKKQSKDSLGDRQKKYENVNRHYLISRLPVTLRVDGKSFKTYTKKLIKPFDDDFMDAMDAAAIKLCGNIQGTKFAYVQSDEITIYLDNLSSLQADLWFDGNIQKIVSVSASLATNGFNEKRLNQNKLIKFAEFDSRVFQLPNFDEVLNNFIWRQQDATRNSISSVAQANFSQKELHGVNTDGMQELLFTKKGINWNEFSPRYKRGRVIYQTTVEVQPQVFRNRWVVDNDIPIFTQDRNYLRNFIGIELID